MKDWFEEFANFAPTKLSGDTWARKSRGTCNPIWNGKGFDTIATCFFLLRLKLHQATERSYFTTASLKAFQVALVKPVASLIYSGVIKSGRKDVKGLRS
jgi:hypothetical protein